MKIEKIIFLTLFCVFAITAYSQRTNVYVSSHPDDWQLFMNPNAFNSIEKDNKVVFIHTTAGDAGSGTGRNNYYLAREEGSLRGIRFMVNTVANGTQENSLLKETVTVNNHNLLKYTYGNAVAYFFRLPDGGPGGNGYQYHNFESLTRLYNGQANKLSAIDNTTSYDSADDFKNTIEAIINSEIVESDSVIFNLPDTDMTINAGDHIDHQYSSLFFQDVAQRFSKKAIRLYLGYITQEKEGNLSTADYYNNAGTWGATTSGIADLEHPSSWNNGHNVWVDKQYFRYNENSNKSANIKSTLKLISNKISDIGLLQFKWNSTDLVDIFIYDHEGGKIFEKKNYSIDDSLTQIPANSMTKGYYKLIVGKNDKYKSTDFEIIN